MEGLPQGRAKRVKGHAHTPGLWNVLISRTKHPKHHRIPEGQMQLKYSPKELIR